MLESITAEWPRYATMLESIIAEWPRYATPESIAAFGTGILLGALIVWWFMRRRVRAAPEQRRGILTERLEANNRQIQDLKEENQHLRGTHTEIHADLRAQAELRSAAEEKNQRLPELEALLQSKEAALDRLREEISEERRATEEKLHLLNEAQARLSDTFKTLSADALKSNNQTFLELAKTSLERFHVLLLSYRLYLGQGAKGELEARPGH